LVQRNSALTLTLCRLWSFVWEFANLPGASCECLSVGRHAGSNLKVNLSDLKWSLEIRRSSTRLEASNSSSNSTTINHDPSPPAERKTDSS
jgi:hypothetical protein